ncbi:MAG: Flagellar hook-length control protein FliK [Bacteroidetes bacterium]|nr:Flagellar hook-length control protein FliK [Bacteroidota bacterium]
MKTKLFVLPLIVFFAILLPNNIKAQEFPVTSSTDVSMLGEVAFDGTNYLFGFAEGSNSMVSAQFISSTGGLVGQKISLGYSGGAPLVEFDGTNYLLLWSAAKQVFNPDKAFGDTIFGQFLNTSGALVGNRFIIAINATISSPKGGCLDYNNGLYMVVFKQNDINYALTISPSGVISTPIQLSSITSGDNAMAFDGTNYLVAWWTHGVGSYDYEQDIYGQFISSTGSLVGGTFVIDDDNTNSDNPLSMAYDGNKYMVTYHVESETNGAWELFSRFVSTSGIVDNRICLRDSTYNPSFAYTSFDGTNYLVTWADSAFSMQSVIKGRYYTPNGTPLDNNIFTIFTTINGDVPMYAGNFFTNNKFLVVTFRIDPSNFIFGDIYGAFVPSSASILDPIGLDNDNCLIYPNPAIDYLDISILSNKKFKSINIYDVFGKRLISQSFNQENLRIDISKLCSGIYFVELTDGINKGIKKIVIRK